MRRMWLNVSVSALITLSLTLLANNFLGVNYQANELLKSPEDNFYLIEVSGRYGGIVTYLVVKNNEVQYATKSCFDGRKETRGTWGMNSDDFFVVSDSSGVYYYRKENGQWEEYYFYFEEDGQGNLVCSIQTSDVANQVMENYDVSRIPHIVYSHIEQILQR